MASFEKQPRILDRATYSRKTLETFEMIAAYYIDLFYNHLYFEAKKLRNDKVVSSITEGYKHTLTSFLQGIEDPRLYKKSLLAMHTFFIDNGFSSITFTQCMERVTREFIPEDYYDSVINSKKNSILRSMLNSVNKNFILKLVNNYLSMVIDQHNEPDNTRMLQDEFIDLLLIEKESMYKRFIVGKTTNHKSGSSNVLESMQREIKLLCAEKYEQKKLVVNLKKIIISKEKQHSSDLAKIEQLNNIINELKNELQDNNLKPSVGVETALMYNSKEMSSDEVIGEADEVIGEADKVIEERTSETYNRDLRNAARYDIPSHKTNTEPLNKKEETYDESVLEEALTAQLEDTSSMITFDENIDIWE